MEDLKRMEDLKKLGIKKKDLKGYERKEIEVKAIQGGNGNIAYIHGKAPFQVQDAMAHLGTLRGRLTALEAICQCEVSKLSADAETLLQAMEAVIPFWEVDNIIEYIADSFPDETRFNRYRKTRGEGQ